MGALVADLTWKAAGSLREGQRPKDTRDGHREGRRRPWTGKGTRERGAVSEPRRRAGRGDRSHRLGGGGHSKDLWSQVVGRGRGAGLQSPRQRGRSDEVG